MARPGLLAEMKKTFLLHAIAAYFSNGFIPVAVPYLLPTLPMGDIFFERTVRHLFWITLLAIPVFVFLRSERLEDEVPCGKSSGVHEKDIRLSVVLFVLCVPGVALRLGVPDTMTRTDLLHWLHWFCVAVVLAMLPVVTLLWSLWRRTFVTGTPTTAEGTRLTEKALCRYA